MRKELAHWSEEKWCTYSEACIESQILLPKNPEVEEAERQVEQAREARALAREREATLDGRVRHEKWQVADKILGGRVMEVPWEELDEAFDDAIEHPDMAELVGELETATEERWKADSEMADALSRLGALRSGDEDSGFCQVYDLIVWDNLRCVEGVARGSQAHHRMRGSKRQARPNTASRTRGSRRCAPRSSSDDSDPGGGEPPGEPAPSTGGQHKTEGQVVA